MKVIDPGYRYELSDGKILDFIKRSVENNVYDGTTNEEILEVLMHRIDFQNQNIPCDENIIALQHLTGALDAINERALKRAIQKQQNTDIPTV